MVGDYSGRISGTQQRFDSNWCFGALLFLVWIRFTAYAYALAVLKRIPIINLVADYLFPFAVVVLILLAFPYIQKRIGISEIFVYISMLMTMMTSLFFNERNSFYIERELEEILLAIVPMVFVGACYDHSQHKRVLFWASAISVLTSVLFQMFLASSGREFIYDSMGTAYRILPGVMYLIYWAFENKRTRFWVLAAIGIGLELIFGTRGPILCILVYISVGFLLTGFKGKSRFNKVLILMIMALAVLLVSGDALKDIAKSLSEIFEEWGVSTRIFDYYIEGEMDEMSGRDYIAERLWMAIKENPIVGYGIMGDRPILRGAYAHNLFLELWAHYGLFLGTAVILAIVGLVIKAFRYQKNDFSMVLFLSMMISFVFIKLMVSNSYIRDEHFFFLLGLVTATIRNKTKHIY